MSAVKTITASPHRALSLARATWLVVALLAIALFLVSAWAYYQVLLSDPFFDSAVKPAVTDLKAVRVGLGRVGLTLQTYAAILLAGQVIITAACCILSAVIFWRRSTERLAWIMSVILLMIGTLVPVQTYALAQLYPALSFLGFAVNQIGTFSNFVLLWIFPDGRFVPAWSRWTLLVVVVLGIPATLFRDSALSAFGALIAFVLIASAIIAQVYRYVRVSGPVERQQTRWVVSGLIAAPLLWIIGALLLPAVFPSLTRTSEDAVVYDLVRSTLNNFASFLIPLTIGIAILRYRLYDIDIIIHRTLVYVPLTAILAGIFAASITLSQKLFIAVTGKSSDAATVFTTLVVVAAFEPLKTGLQHLVDRRFKDVPDPTKKLKTVGDQMRAVLQVIDVEQMARRVLDEAVSAYDARGGAIYLDANGNAAPFQITGEWNGDAQLSLPLQNDGTTFGKLALGARRNGAEYTAQDRATLQQVADLTARAIAIHERPNGVRQ